MHYEKGGIENRDPKVMVEKIEKLHDDYRNLYKITQNIVLPISGRKCKLQWCFGPKMH